LDVNSSNRGVCAFLACCRPCSAAVFDPCEASSHLYQACKVDLGEGNAHYAECDGLLFHGCSAVAVIQATVRLMIFSVSKETEAAAMILELLCLDEKTDDDKRYYSLSSTLSTVLDSA
jgi:hypothetical protein